MYDGHSQGGTATVVRSEPRGLSRPAVYTFLGLATLPRFRGRADGHRTRGARHAANLLRLHMLPREMVLHIARFAYRAGYHAHWVDYGNDEEAAVAIDVTNSPNSVTGLSLSRMVSSKTYYVEVRLTHAWWGTRLELHGLGQRFRFVLENNGDGADTGNIGNIACFWQGPADGMLSMSSLGVDSWSYTKDPVTVSVLVDMVRGCATFGLNGLAGPCVRFPGDTWRDGVHIVARGFPQSRGRRCIVACATPPTPPSMLAAASHPMTVSEHLAAGALRTEAGAFGSQIDVNPPWVN